MLPNLRVASPCSADWEKMGGDDRVRYCRECSLNVYNFSVMSESEIQQLILTHEGRLCGRLYRRKDGTVLTRDCPAGFKVVVRRISRLAGTALSAAISLSLAAAQTSNDHAPSLVQINLKDATVTIAVRDSSGSVIPGAWVSLSNQASRSKSEGTTDSQGKLRLSNLVPGSYALTVGHSGFVTFSQVVSASGDKTADVHLSVDNSPEMGVMVMEPYGPEAIPTSLPNLLPTPGTSAPSSPPQSGQHKSILQKLLSPFRRVL